MSPPHEAEVQQVLLYDLEFYYIQYNLLTITFLLLFITIQLILLISGETISGKVALFEVLGLRIKSSPSPSTWPVLTEDWIRARGGDGRACGLKRIYVERWTRTSQSERTPSRGSGELGPKVATKSVSSYRPPSSHLCPKTFCVSQICPELPADTSVFSY